MYSSVSYHKITYWIYKKTIVRVFYRRSGRNKRCITPFPVMTFFLIAPFHCAHFYAGWFNSFQRSETIMPGL